MQQLPSGFRVVQPGPSLPTQQPRSQQPIPRVIEGPPRQPPPQTEAQAQGDTLQNEIDRENLRRMRMGTPPAGYRFNDAGELEVIPNSPQAREQTQAEARERAVQSDRVAALEQMRNVIANARDAQRLSREGWFTTGFGASVARRVAPGGSAPADLQTILGHIGSNTAFDRLQRMREASPTGGALGAVTERELQLLQDSIASLDVTQSDERFQQSMQRVIDAYGRVYQGLGGNPSEIAGGDQIPGGPDSQIRFLDEIPEGDPRDFTDEQRERIRDFAARARTPEELDAFARGLSGGQIGIPNAAEVLEHFRRTGELGGVSPLPAPDISDARGQGGVGETVDAAIRGVADVPTFGIADEISAGLDTVFNGGSLTDNLARQRAIDAYDTENNLGARLTGQIAGGLGLPSGAAGAGRSAARSALRAGQGRVAAQASARDAVRRRLTSEGAAFGMGYGVGSAEGDLGDRLEGGVTSALIGGGSANALARVGGAIASRGQSPNALLRRADRQEAADAAQAATDLGIEMLPADLGGAGTRWATSIARQTPGGVVPITMGSRRVATQSEQARNRIAGDIGQAVEPEAAGQAATRGAQTWRQTSGAEGRRNYRRAAALAGDTDIAPQNTMQTLSRLIREERQVPGGTDALPVIEHYAQAFANGGPITIEGARAMRSALRQRLTAGNMTPDNADRITNQIMDAVSQDITASLTAAGRQDAVRAYRQADDFWRQRLDTIRDAIAPIIGRRGEKSGEQVLQSIMQSGRGNSVRLGRFINSLPEEEASTVRATLIQQLGRSSPGQQNSEGTAFSLNTFLTHWNSLQPGARRALFGEETRRSLDNLARVANRSREAQRFSNFSNTGQTIAGVAQLGHFYTDPFSASLSMVGQYGAGRLLASPRFANWLARMPRDPNRARSHVDQLSRIARSSPAIAAEVTGLQQAILEQIGSEAE